MSTDDDNQIRVMGSCGSTLEHVSEVEHMNNIADKIAKHNSTLHKQHGNGLILLRFTTEKIDIVMTRAYTTRLFWIANSKCHEGFRMREFLDGVLRIMREQPN